MLGFIETFLGFGPGRGRIAIRSTPNEDRGPGSAEVKVAPDEADFLNAPTWPRSKFNGMRKILVLFGIATAVVVGLATTKLTADIAATNSQVPPEMLLSIPPKQLFASQKLSPGVYRTTPYSMTVIVPECSDSAMVLNYSDPIICQIRVSKPDVEFKRIENPPSINPPRSISPSVHSNLLFSAPNPAPQSTVK
jgi:hypothetical protein